MYRVALIVDGLSVAKQYRDILDWALSQPDIEVVALVVQDLPAAKPRGALRKLAGLVRSVGLYRALSRVAFSLLVRAESRLLRGARAYLEAYDIGNLVACHLHISPILSKTGHVYRYDEQDLGRLEALDLDLLIRCGSGILRGAILTCAKHGIVSLHHGDNRINRGGPPGFWEVLKQQAYTGFVVQRLGDELDGGEVLFRGSVPTEITFLRNRISVYENSTQAFQVTIRRMLGGECAPESPHLYFERLYKAPLLGNTLRYCLQTAWLAFKRMALRKLSIREHWQVAFLEGDWRHATLRRGVTVPHPKTSFLADPFAVAVDGKNYVFVEEFSYAWAKGVISVHALGPGKRDCHRIGVALEEDFHLSYPFLFRDGDTLYMCPETKQCRQIRLYKCVGFPLEWELASVVMDDVLAVDTNIFQRGGKWWLMTSIQRSPVGGYSSLHVFHSNAPLGPWSPMASNPVCVDASRGRNGGMLSHGDDIYRVSQRARFGHYGSALTIHRIEKLDENEYREVEVQSVEPNFFPGLKGAHHLHNAGGVLVYDFWKYARVR